MAQANRSIPFLLLLAGVLSAQSYPPYPAPSGQYPPSSAASPEYSAGTPPYSSEEAADQQHGVARLSTLQGEVNVRRGDTSDLVAAVVNAPLLTRDRLQTSPASAAEVQLDGVNLIRLAENTDVGFADLAYGKAQLQLGAGTLIYRALRESQMAVEIQTPSVAVRPLGAADLRISLLEGGVTQVTVRTGAADMFGPRGAQRLEAPRSVLVRGNPSDPEFQDATPPPQDAVDDWSASRDSQLLASSSDQYTGSDMAGIGDLDANGSWVNSQYGQVWAPRPPTAGWAPYSYGQWVDEPYYGWTWVDAAPWGWAPYHYGRWFLNGSSGWCWWPGGSRGRHYWGPAYVGFFGFGGGGSLGWTALAPYEGFHSWWGGGGWRGNYGYRGRGSEFGLSVLGTYRNAGVRGGAIVAGVNSFGGSRGRFNFATRDSLARATLLQGRLPVAAGSSFRFSDRQAIANPRLAGAAGRSFFQAGSAYRSNVPVRTAPNAGWQRFGDPRVPGNYRQGFTGAVPAGSSNRESGWHQFGQPPPAQGNGRTYGQSYRQPQYPQSYSSGYRSYSPSTQQTYRSPQQSYRYNQQQQPTYRMTPQQSYRPPQPSAPSQPRSFSGYDGGGYRGGSGPKNETNSHTVQGSHNQSARGAGGGHQGRR